MLQWFRCSTCSRVCCNGKCCSDCDVIHVKVVVLVVYLKVFVEVVHVVVVFVVVYVVVIVHRYQ